MTLEPPDLDALCIEDTRQRTLVARRPALLALVLLTSCPLNADLPTQGDASGEHLLAEPPAGWTRSHSIETAVMRLTEFTPRGESRGQWQAKVSFEAFAAAPLPETIQFLANLAAEQTPTCAKFEHASVFAGVENGYPTAISLFHCQDQRVTGHNQVTLVKTIRGNERFYVISRAERYAPDTGAPLEARIVGLALYLRAIGLCDPGRPEHPCTNQNDSSANPISEPDDA